MSEITNELDQLALPSDQATEHQLQPIVRLIKAIRTMFALEDTLLDLMVLHLEDEGSRDEDDLSNHSFYLEYDE